MRYSEDFINDLKERVPISEVIRTRVTWDHKKTRARRGDYWGCCPFHGENNPSFHCLDARGIYHCFACGASGNHFKFFMELDGVSFPRAVEMVAAIAGINLPGREETEQERQRRQQRQEERRRADARRAVQEQRRRARRTQTVRELWRQGVPITGTLAETYLRSRDIHLDEWPASLRFHPSLDYPLSDQNLSFPALICGVQSKTRELIGLWRIYLDPDTGAKAPVENSKVGLGPSGGGAVRLGPVTETLRVTEGVETGLAVMLLTDQRSSTWASLSTSGMVGLEIPEGVRRLHIYADGDRYRDHKRTGKIMKPPGIAAAEKLKAKAESQGIQARIYPSPEPDDWLDVWQVRFKDEQQQRAVEYRD